MRERRERFSGVKGEKEEKENKKTKKKNGIINGAQTVLMIKDQIGHFVKPLDVFGNTPNLRVGYYNLPYIYIYMKRVDMKIPQINKVPSPTLVDIV